MTDCDGHKVAALFVDKSSREWVVCDAEGNFWRIPAGGTGWEGRRPYPVTEDCDLERVPKHYQYALRLPF